MRHFYGQRCVWALERDNPMKTRIGTGLLVIVGFVLAIALAEILVRVFIPQDRMVTWIEMHPLGFMMNQPDIEAIHHFDERRLKYSFNEWGLRGDESIDIDGDALNILLLGDSFTFGLLLERESTYPYLLEKDLARSDSVSETEILNGGVGGAGLADWPGWLDQFGQPLQPDIVILYLNVKDVDRALSKNLYVLQDDSTMVRSMRWEPRSTFFKLGRTGWYRWLQEKSELMNIAVRIAWRYLYFKDITHDFSREKSEVPLPPADAFDTKSDYTLSISKRLLSRLDKWCEKNDCTFILTTTGFFAEDIVGEYTEILYDSLLEDKPQDYYFFDNTPCLLETTGENLESIMIEGDGHPNERGAEIIADCTLEWLVPFLSNHNLGS